MPIAALLAMALVAVAAAEARTSPSAWDDAARQRKSDYIFMEGMRRNAIGEQDSYYELLNRAHSLDTADTQTGFYVGYMQVLMANNDSALFSRGYDLIDRHFRENPSDLYATYVYGNLNEHIGRKYDALHVWAVLDSLYPERPEVTLRYAEALSMTGDTADLSRAISVYDRVETGQGKSLQVSSRKIRAYLSSRDTTAVIAELHDLMKSSPRSSEYRVFVGDVYSMFGKGDSALYYYNRACEVDSTNGLAYYSRANFYKNTGDSVGYDREVFKALKQDNLDLDTKMQLLTGYVKELYSDSMQHPRIQELFKVLIDQHPHEVDIHDLYSAYFVAIERYDSAAEQVGYAIDIDPADENRWRMLMSLYAQSGNMDKAIATGENAMHYHPDSPTLYLLTGSDYAMERDFGKAQAYLRRSLELADSLQPDMRSQILCSIGDAYYQAERSDSAFVYYDMALEEDPGNLLALNNCAYYLACEGRDLDRAERLAALVVKERPDDATSLDTYAWVFFKKGDYGLAKEYIKEALEHADKPSAEIYHHSGDIYFMAGDPDKAIEYWNKAVELEPDNELLQRKVRHKTYFYK